MYIYNIAEAGTKACMQNVRGNVPGHIVRQKNMRTFIYFFFLSLTLDSTAQVDPSKKHQSRIEQLKPSVNLYDSIVRISGWFTIQTYYNQNQCSYYVTENNQKIQCRCGDTTTPCSSKVNYETYQRLFKLLQTNGVLEIASTTWPDLEHYTIRIVYKINKLTGLKHAYIFPIGKIAIAEAKKTRADKEIGENIYLDAYYDH